MTSHQSFIPAGLPEDGLDQSVAPLVSVLQEYLRRDMTGFHVPGHNSGNAAPLDMVELIGSQAFAADVPALPETDNLNNPSGAILHAEQLAAALWGADRTMFLVNGSTLGNQLALLSVCRPGKRVIVSRNAHRSILSGIILAGAIPVFLQPEWDAERCFARNVTTAAVAEALQRHPDATAVVLVSPTYHGFTADVARISELCHTRDMPLVVDEAWGAHLEFGDELPSAAIRSGADIVVQSTHKLLTSLTQSSMIHVASDRVRVRRDVLALMQSTSASYLLLASLDAARRQLAMEGREMVAGALAHARELRAGLRELPGVSSFGREMAGTRGVHDLDETRVTIEVDGLSGMDLARLLNDRYGVQVEMAGLREVLLNVSVGTTEDDVRTTLDAFGELVAHGRVLRESLDDQAALPEPITASESVLTPRDGFFAESIRLPLDAAVGHVSTEMVTPYPPGIPVLVPGERISAEAIEYLAHMRILGATFTGAEDPTLSTINVVAEADADGVPEPDHG